MAIQKKVNSSREAKPLDGFQQRKIRRQQLFMSVTGVVLVSSMVLSLLIK